MEMIMKDVLTPGWLVVLAEHNTVATAGRFQCQGDVLGNRVDFSSNFQGEIKNIFEMLIGDDEHVSRIICPAADGYKGSHQVILENNVRLFELIPVTGLVLDQAAKPTFVVFWGVSVHLFCQFLNHPKMRQSKNLQRRAFKKLQPAS
jgi:hypothetical protein